MKLNEMRLGYFARYLWEILLSTLFQQKNYSSRMKWLSVKQ